MSEEQQQEKPQIIDQSEIGQPPLVVPGKANLSAIPHVVSDEQYQINKRLIGQFRQYRLEQLEKEDTQS